MIHDPKCEVTCDQCKTNSVTIDLTALARGSYDLRNAQSEVESHGWEFISEEEQICDTCIEDRDAKKGEE